MPSDPLEPRPIIAGAVSATAGTGLLAYLANDPHFKRMSTDNMHNFLKGYYNKGGGVPNKLFLQGKEAIKGGTRTLAQGLNPVRSFTFGQTGLSNSLLKTIKDNHAQIAKIKAEFAAGKISFTEANKGIKFLLKEVHFKATNDFSNQRLYGLEPSKPLMKYAGIPQGTGKIPYVAYSTGKQARELIGAQEYQYMKDIWGLGGTKNVAMNLYGRQSIQNPLRAINFDKRVYRVFNELGLTLKNNKGKLTRNQVLGALQHEDLLFSKKQLYNRAAYPTKMQYKPLFRDLGKGKIAFNMSPAMKPNFDWGGFNGMVVWDEKRPKFVKLLASDKRDVLGIPQKKPVLNYVAPQELSLENFDKDLKAMQEKLEKEVDKSLEKKTRKKGGGRKKGSKNKTTPIKTVEDLADNKGMKTLTKHQKGLLDAEGKALIEAKKPGNQKYQNYLRTRWLPSRLKLAGMLGLAIGGGAMLWKDIHEQSRD